MNRIRQISRIDRLAAAAVVLLLTGFAFPSQMVRLKYFDIAEDGSAFVLSWESAEEDGIQSFEVERKTTFSNNEFVVLQTVPSRGSDFRYIHRDDQVFKTASEVVDYRLMAIHSNGAREILITKSVNYAPTALRRTWGSIKAMF